MQRTVEIDLEVHVSGPDDEDTERYQPVTLFISDLVYLVIEPPGLPNVSHAAPSLVDGGSTELVTIAENVDWKQRGPRMRVFYTEEFTTANEKTLARKKGEFWEGELKTCASQVLRHARSAIRKLTIRS